MKKVLAVILVFVMVFCFAACGNDAAGDETKVDESMYPVVYDELVGQYQDTVSMRAVANIERTQDGCFMVVSWGNSATESVVWEMTLEYDGEKLNYKDCKTSLVTYGDDDSFEEEVLSENGEGYFVLTNGGFLNWEGASDEQCKTCSFEKMEELVEE